MTLFLPTTSHTGQAGTQNPDVLDKCQCSEPLHNMHPLGISQVSKQLGVQVVGFMGKQTEKSEPAPQTHFQGNIQPGISSEESPQFGTICQGEFRLGMVSERYQQIVELIHVLCESSLFSSQHNDQTSFYRQVLEEHFICCDPSQ